MIQFELQDHLQALTDIDSYDIPNDHDFTSDDPETLLEAAVVAVAENPDAISVQEVFDIFRSLLKHSDQIPSSVMSKLLDTLSSGLQQELDNMARDIDTGDQQTYSMHKAPMEIYAFLLQWFTTAAEKVKPSDDAPAPAKGRKGKGAKAAAGRGTGKKTEWTWEDQIPATMALIVKVLRYQKLPRVWTATAERDTFLQCLIKPAYRIAESEKYMKSDNVKNYLITIICLAVKHHGQSMAVQISIDGFLQFYEHLSETMAECLITLANDYNHTQLGDEVIRDIASKTFNAQDNKSPRSFSNFLRRYAASCPRSIVRQFSLLQDQLDSESYPIRQVMIEAVGFIILDLIRNQGGETGQASPETVQKQIDQYFDVLFERTLDISGYVRVKVYQTMKTLLPLPRQGQFTQLLRMTQLAVSALEDKLSSVRRAATALLIALIKNHPWAGGDGSLNREKWEKHYKDAKEELTKLEAEISKVVQPQEPQGEEEGSSTTPRAGDDSMDVDGDTEKEDEGEDTEREEGDNEGDDMAVDEDGEDGETQTQQKPKKKKKASKLKPRKSILNMDAMTQEQEVLARHHAQEITRLSLMVRFSKDCLSFITTVEQGITHLCALLGSPTKGEVLEIISFFETAHDFQFETAEIGVKKMLHLIWQKDNTAAVTEDGESLKGIRQAVLECYKNIYFEPLAGDSEKDAVNRVTKNLVEYTYDATLAELTSLEELLRVMMEANEIKPEVISRLWHVYGKQKQLPKAQRRAAIIILGMLAVAERGIVKDKVPLMQKVGLGKLGQNDPTLARYTCVALQRLNGSAKKVKGSLQDKTIRFKSDEPIFASLHAVLDHPTRSPEWFGLAEQAINTVYALAEHPDVWCDVLIKRLTARVFNKPKTAAEPPAQDRDASENPEDQAGEETNNSPDVDMADATQTQTQSSSSAKDEADAFELSQLLFVVGHVALKQIVFLELVERELKRQKDESQAAENKNAKDKASKDGEDLDQIVGNAEDEIGDRIAFIREQEMLYGDNSLLAVFGPMIIHICGSPQIFKNKTLRAAATLSLSKFLCVSSRFCDENHKLLFKILEISKIANIRSNIVIALGDVAVSFSNIIDENSNELYKGLSDKDFVVKKNTLMVLTHLILNGMIKVKGQLGEMAKCLGDENEQIESLAKLFFTQLATKDNAIYNNLPDVISHLSTGEHSVEEEVFRKTLRYIFTFIEKDKQAESIVEKLCQRFKISEEPRQWRDIAFCLSLLPYKSERSIKKLQEGLQFYRDKLHEPKVYEQFTEILTKARQARGKDKPDADLDEFEAELNKHRARGEDDEALQKRVNKKKAAAAKRRAPATRAKKAAPARRETPDDDMYSD